MLTIAAIMGLMATGSSSASVPQGDWSVQQTGTFCMASRTFLINGAAVGVGFEPLPLGTRTGVIIVEQGAAKGVAIGSVTITRASAGVPHATNYSSWPAANNHRVVRFAMSDEDLGPLETDDVITLEWDGEALAIPLDGFPKADVEQCDASGLANLGIDMAGERRIPTPPKHLAKSGAMAGDYPISAIRRGEQGVVDMILNVDQDGRVTDCRVATSSGYDDLDAASCKIARRARYDPARDAQGKRVQAHLSTQTVWILPDRGTPAPHGVP